MSLRVLRSLANAGRTQYCVRSQVLMRSMSVLARAAPVLNKSVQHHNLVLNNSFSSEPTISDKISGLVKDEKVVVFMKGVPAAPQCGFSNAVVQIMRMHDVTFASHNVLADEELRQGIKDFSNWPTIPQVYFEGEFIGGCDILLQMHQSGELIEELEKIGIKSALLDEEQK